MDPFEELLALVQRDPGLLQRLAPAPQDAARTLAPGTKGRGVVGDFLDAISAPFQAIDRLDAGTTRALQSAQPQGGIRPAHTPYAMQALEAVSPRAADATRGALRGVRDALRPQGEVGGRVAGLFDLLGLSGHPMEFIDAPVAAASSALARTAGRPKLQAAFRHPITGAPIPTGAAHDLEMVGDKVARRLIEDGVATNPQLAGFVDEAGNYYTREQAAALVGAAKGESSMVGAVDNFGGAPAQDLPLLGGGTLPTPAPSGVQLKNIQRGRVGPGHQQLAYDILDDGGRRVGEVGFTIGPDGAARIGDIRSTGGPGSLGVANVRTIQGELQRLHPEITSFSGGRVSGTRGRSSPGTSGGEVTVPAVSPGRIAHEPHEFMPAASSGHLPGLFSNPEAKAAFEAENVYAPGGRDALYEAAGLQQRPPLTGQGVYTNSRGEVEFNKAIAGRPVVSNTITDAEREALDAVASARGYLGVQEGSPWSHFSSASAPEARSAVQFPISGPVSAEEMNQLNDLFSARGMWASDGGNRLLAGPFDPTAPGLPSAHGDAGLDSAVRGILGERVGPMRAGAPSGNYIDYDWGTPGSGTATRQLLERAGGNPRVAEILNNEGVRDVIGDVVARDRRFGKVAGGARTDIQRARSILQKGGLQALQRALDSGVELPGLAPLLIGGGAGVAGLLGATRGEREAAPGGLWR